MFEGSLAGERFWKFPISDNVLGYIFVRGEGERLLGAVSRSIGEEDEGERGSE
jgi:hypothetical protein